MGRITNQEFSESLISELNLKVDHANLKKVRSGKDAEGIFTTVEYRRLKDNTLAVKAVLSGGVSPNYTTRTFTYYAENGTDIVKTNSVELSYDIDGDLVSEV